MGARWERIPGRKNGGLRLAKSKQELKVGCVYDIELRLIFDPPSQEWLQQGHAVNNSYIAYLGGPEGVGVGAATGLGAAL